MEKQIHILQFFLVISISLLPFGFFLLAQRLPPWDDLRICAAGNWGFG